LSGKRLIAGLDRFDKQRPGGRGVPQPVLPLNIGKVHAIKDFLFQPAEIYREPQFCEHPMEYKKALCGAVVKVVLPKVFDPGDPDVCPTCSAAGYSR
jgi:hypothetical protein